MQQYTYSHNKPDGTPFYIGKGSGNRAHKGTRNIYWKRVVAKYGYEVQILAYWKTHKEALDHEKLLISCFKDMGIKLANFTDGGEGCENPSEETRLKMSLAKKGRTSPRKGAVLTNEQKIKLSISGKQKARKTLRKLSSKQVKEIKSLKNVISGIKIAKQFNVTRNVIYGIFNNLTYIEE
jgi:hypothetical protein